ncbi:hypothetical protein, partial [Caulobacter sp. D5]|uniref:hypothetical protein n=2 Tax=unclassified Caulobacter TaxID=2648921 RepID=UPI0018EE97C0
MKASMMAGAAWLAIGLAAQAEETPRVDPVQIDSSRPDWENPAVNARGKMPASASHFPFESRAAAL